MSQKSSPLDFLKSIGPAIIVAAVVLGPGSIILSSKAGATIGFSAFWVLAAAIFLLIGMVRLAAHVGLAYERTPCQELAARLGKPVSIGIGIVLFLLIAGFQTSNNVAVAAAIDPIFGSQESPLPDWVPIASVATLNLLALLALYCFRSLYKRIETIMKALVFVMIAAFIVNAIAAIPSMLSNAGTIVPTLPDKKTQGTLIGLIATTFSVAAAFYQAYLVRERGWSLSDSQRIRRDSLFGILVLGALSMLIIATSVAAFHGKSEAVDLKTATDVAKQLEPLFGGWAKLIFGLGILAAAFSSFLVNAMIGGTILSDGLGLGARLSDRWPRHLTAAALLFGMTVGLICVSSGSSPVAIIASAQALTVVGVPALAAALLYLGTRPELTGERRLSSFTLAVASIGALLTIPLAIRTIYAVIDKFQNL